MKNKLISIIVLSIVLIGGFYFGAQAYKISEQERLGFLAADNIKKFYPDYSPSYGNKDAKVVVTEFLDPECESCRRFYPQVKKVLSMYKEKVQLVVRYAAFHRNSTHAIKVLEATRKQNKFWESLEFLFVHQATWASHHDPKPLLVFNLLPEVGVDIEQLKKDMLNPEIVKHIEQDAKDLKELNVRGTPSFFVNGKPLEQFGIGFLYKAISDEVARLYPNNK